VEITKAIITAAGENQRTLPLQTLVDRDGMTKTALTIIIEEILAAGIEAIAVIVNPGDQMAFSVAAGEYRSRLTFIEQKDRRGYGHAVYCAKDFCGESPVLLLVGDHLYVSQGGKNCAQQLIDAAKSESCMISAVQPTLENKIIHYGTVGGRLCPGRKGLYQIENVIEKPTPTQAEQELIVPGLRTGFYLCFFGMHVLTTAVMDELAKQCRDSHPHDNIQLSPVLARLATREKYLAYEIQGNRYDIGLKYGLFTAQLALALAGQDRQEILAQLVEMLALRKD
jgi:UTP--glucose-1-phosphate uridylyltransferase